MPSLLDTTVTANYLKNVKANGLGPRTLVVSLSKTNITEAEVNAAINKITLSQGSNGSGDSAFVVAGLSSDQSVTVDGIAKTLQFVSGTSDVVYLAIQGTGDLTVGANFGATGVTAALVATFDQNY